VWCVLASAGVVVRLAPDGTKTRFELADGSTEPYSVAVATRESVWVTDRASDRILRLDASGVVWSAVVPTAGSGLAGIVGLDDGTAWFVEEQADAVGHVDILGRVSEFDTGVPGGDPTSIASDGSSVWFTLPAAGVIAHARGGDSLPDLVRFDDPLAAPADVSIGDDGCLWFADTARRLVGRLGRGGAVAEFALSDPLPRPMLVAADASGGCWFTMEGVGDIGHVDAEGRIVTIPLPGTPVAIAVAPSGEVWLALRSGMLARIDGPGSLAADIQ
jgi:virginiamycin B lyase